MIFAIIEPFQSHVNQREGAFLAKLQMENEHQKAMYRLSLKHFSFKQKQLRNA